MTVDFCLPIKNEEVILEANVLKLLRFLTASNHDFSWQIVGLVNGSSDNSVKIIKDLATKFPDQISYLILEESGKSQAIKTYWRQSEADILAFMDADLAVSLDYLNSLIKPISTGEADLVIGSRFRPDSIVQRSLKRNIVSWFYVNLSKIIIPHKTLDLQCGFKAISKTSFSQIDKLLIDNYWFFDTELVILSEKLGFRIKEIGVSWQEKRPSVSKSQINLIKDSLLFINNLLTFKKRLKKLKTSFTKN